ncbi:MAG TPA: matrixin family metalloprotease [Candidatus Limosilactobacillus intestinigallinarum]|nr:matrixin family metalloprotease [Candidatus Limosilactobacillus intestinigallinarum]
MVGIRKHLFLPLIYLLAFGALIWFYQNSPFFQQYANVAIHDVQVVTYNGLNKLTGRKAPEATQRVDSSHSDATTGARWPQPTATVYVDLSSPILRNAAESAISQWNRTGAFTFQQINDKSKADITITAINENNDNAAGLTNSTTNALTGYITHADVQLNAGYLLDPSYGYSQQRVINTAEHELGHAIGLQHNNGTSVMQPAGSFYTIQPADVAAVRKLYTQNPQTNTNDNNNANNQQAELTEKLSTSVAN